VAFVSPTFPPALGGIERFSEDLASWLAQAGHEVCVLTETAAPDGFDASRPYRVVRGGGTRAAAAEVRRADVVQIKSNSIRSSLLAEVGRTWSVVTHGGHQAVCPAETAWGRDGRCDAGPGRPGPCQYCPRQGLAGRAAMAVQRTAAALADVNVCVSHYLAGRLGVAHTVMIYNPVSPLAFTVDGSGPGDGELVAFAGRFGPAKGGDVLLRAVATLPGVRLELAGDGVMRGAWEQLADDLGIAGRVRFLGTLPREGVAELYSRAGAVCVPSLWEEPFGYSAAEAMALGRPVVATPSGALVEFFVDGRGFIAESRSPADLAAALSTCLADDEARAGVGRRARTFAREQLHVDVIGPEYVEQYLRGARGA
jgi:glycosyltransferase involved in cell wall biosynthesis